MTLISWTYSQLQVITYSLWMQDHGKSLWWEHLCRWWEVTLLVTMFGWGPMLRCRQIWAFPKIARFWFWTYQKWINLLMDHLPGHLSKLEQLLHNGTRDTITGFLRQATVIDLVKPFSRKIYLVKRACPIVSQRTQCTFCFVVNGRKEFPGLIQSKMWWFGILFQRRQKGRDT